MSNLRRKFSKTYDQYVDKIYRFIFIKVNSQEVAEDLTSETFLRGWKSFQETGTNIKNPPAFLYQIARNLVVDHYRQKGQTNIVSTEAVSIIDPRKNLEEKAGLNSEIEAVLSVLSNLKEDYQEVINLHYLDDLSVKETAEILNRPEGTIRVMIHRALKELRESLSD